MMGRERQGRGAGPFDAPIAEGDLLLEVDRLEKHFPVRSSDLVDRGAVVRAVDGVSFDLKAGETLGLVGESGCGKSTTSRCVARLLEPSRGSVRYRGIDVSRWSSRRLRPFRRQVQMVFQDPFASLNPRMSVEQLIAEPLRIFRTYDPSSSPRWIQDLLERVGLSAEHARRYPHEFSGGQRQRIGIARALALEPRLLVLDEPVSALDVSVQAQVINLLEDLQGEFGLSYLLVAHDLSVVRHACDRIAVMYLGKIVEVGSRHEIFNSPRHPYTQALLSSVPISDPSLRGKRERIVLEGDVPSPVDPPPGCRFHPRCWKADERCRTDEPLLVRRDEGHPSACHYAESVRVL